MRKIVLGLATLALIMLAPVSAIAAHDFKCHPTAAIVADVERQGGTLEWLGYDLNHGGGPWLVNVWVSEDGRFAFIAWSPDGKFGCILSQGTLAIDTSPPQDLAPGTHNIDPTKGDPI